MRDKEAEELYEKLRDGKYFKSEEQRADAKICFSLGYYTLKEQTVVIGTGFIESPIIIFLKEN